MTALLDHPLLARAWAEMHRVAPVDALDNTKRAQLQSRHTRGGKVPTYEEAAAREYAAQQAPGSDYDRELREGFEFKYGAACGAE